MSADDASSAHVVGPEEAKPQADGAQVGAEEERRDARGGTDDGSATKGHGDADRDQPPTTTDDEDFNQRPTETETETETKKPQPQPPCDCDNEPSGSRDCEKEGCEYKCDTDTVANITPDASVVAVTSSDTPVTVKNEVATITEETKTALEEGVECENISTCITVEKGSNTEACDVASVSTTVEEGAGGTVVVPGLGEACNCDQDIKASETNTTATELPGIAEGKRRVDPTPIPEDCTTKDAASGSSGDNVSNCVPTGPDLSVPIVDAVERKPPASVPQLDPTGNTKVPEVDIRKTEEAVVTVLTKLEIEPEKGLETEVAVETHSTPIDNPTQEKDLTKSIDMTKLEPNSTVESVHDLTVANTSSAHETTKDSPPIQKETSSNPVIISETQPDQATTPSALNPPEHPTVSVITPEVQITRKGGDVEPQITPHSGKATSCCCDSCTAKKKTENDNKSNELHGLQLPKLPLLPQQQTQTSSSPQQTSEKPLPEKQSTLHQRAIYHQRQAVLDGGIGICGICACNNLLQKPHFTKQQFELIADSLAPDSPPPPEVPSGVLTAAQGAALNSRQQSPTSSSSLSLSSFFSSVSSSSFFGDRRSSPSSNGNGARATSQAKAIDGRHKFALGLGFYDANVVIYALQMVGLCCIWHDIRIQVDTHNLVFKKPSSSSTTLSSPFSVSLPALPSTPVSTTQLSPIPSPTPPIPIQSPSTTASSSIPAQTPSTTSTSDSNLTLLGVVVNVAQPVKWGGMSFGATGGSLLSALGMGPLSLTRHWISCRSVDDTWYAFDSTHSTPDLIGTVVEAAAFLNACIKVGATVIKVFKKSRKDHTDDNDWVHVENGSS